jgi:hypothetical protein
VIVRELDAVLETIVDHATPSEDFSIRYPVKTPPFRLFGATHVSLTLGVLGVCELNAFFAERDVGASAGSAASLIAGATKVASSARVDCSRGPNPVGARPS